MQFIIRLGGSIEIVWRHSGDVRLSVVMFWLVACAWLSVNIRLLVVQLEEAIRISNGRVEKTKAACQLLTRTSNICYIITSSADMSNTLRRLGRKKDVITEYKCTIRLLDDNEVLQCTIQVSPSASSASGHSLSLGQVSRHWWLQIQ